MNSIQFYAHLALAHHPDAQREKQLAEEVKEHFRKTLSVETVTAQLRERLVRRRKREAIETELERLERELRMIAPSQDGRVAPLQRKIEEMKKKIGLTGPLP